MKKSLVALAALAATASFAQSTVTISGIMDANYSAITNLGDQVTNQVGQNGARTTTFKFNGSEDLGGGMAAVFQFEVQPSLIAGDGNKFSGVYPAATTGVASNNVSVQSSGAASAQSGLVGKGQSYVGLNTTNGNVKLGTINTNTFGSFAAVSQLATGIGSGYGSGNTFGDFTRVESAVSYETPTFNGFSGSLLKGTKNDAQFGTASTTTANAVTLRRPSVLDWGIQYANGPLAARYSQLASTADPLTGLTTTTKLMGAVYDAGVAKFSAATGSQKTDAASSALDARINIAAVTVPFMGSYRAILQSGSVKINGGSTGSYNVGEKNKTSGWALEKDLSKRTYVYLRGENTDFAAASTKSFVINGAVGTTVGWAGTSSKRNVTAVGISHAF